jgi:hypothetical protein
MKYFNIGKTLFIVVAVMGGIAQAGTRGGGDSAQCGTSGRPQIFLNDTDGYNKRVVAAEFMDLRNNSPIPSGWFDGITEEKILDAMISYLDFTQPSLASDLRIIRAQLDFKVVDKFSDPDIPDTGFHVAPVKWLYTDCYRVFTAKQDFENNTVELLKKYYQGVKTNPAPDYMSRPGLDNLNQAILKFHELDLNHNHQLNSTLPLAKLETMTRGDVTAVLKSPNFFPYIMSQGLRASGKDERYVNEMGLTALFWQGKYWSVEFENSEGAFEIRQENLQKSGLCTVHPSKDVVKAFYKAYGKDAFNQDASLCQVSLLTTP